MKSLLFIPAFSFCLATNASFSQTQGIAYTAVGKGVATTFLTDYHCLGINNSALGWGTGYDNKRFTAGMTEFNFGMYSDSLNVDRLQRLFKVIRSDVRDETTEATWEEQQTYSAEYMNSGIAFDAHYNWLGFSFQSEKFGGFAFNINESYNWYSRLNEDLTDIIFKGRLSNYFDSLTVVFGTDTSMIPNTGNLSEDTLAAVIQGSLSNPLSLSQLTEGSEIRFAWNRYYNFGYGRKLVGNDSTFAVYGGIGGRFIQSMAMFDMRSDGKTIHMYASYNPNYDINYGSIAEFNPSEYTVEGFIPKPVGMGYGIDLSASVFLMKSIRIAAAVNNIGSVTYRRNVYTVEDSDIRSVDLEGLDNENINNSVYMMLEDGGIMNLVGQESYTVKNASTYRLGSSIEMGKFMRLGIDVVGPFDSENPGGLTNPVFSIGGDIRPLKWLYISAGYLGGGLYRHNIPLGVNFVLGGGAYELGISSRDALSFITNNSNSISTAFGFVRVRF